MISFSTIYSPWKFSKPSHTHHKTWLVEKNLVITRLGSKTCHLYNNAHFPLIGIHLNDSFFYHSLFLFPLGDYVSQYVRLRYNNLKSGGLKENKKYIKVGDGANSL